VKPPWYYMTSGDWLVVVLLLSASLIGMAMVAATPRGTSVVVTSSGQTCFIAPLDQPRSVDIQGPLGMTHLVIDEHGAQITSSPCPHKICISMSPIRRSGEILACVPNRVLVRIDSHGDEEPPYDLLSR
jgi:hypothetical protein